MKTKKYEVKWREGRPIPKKGREELDNAGISDKIGLVSAHIEELSYRNYCRRKKQV